MLMVQDMVDLLILVIMKYGVRCQLAEVGDGKGEGCSSKWLEGTWTKNDLDANLAGHD